MELTRAALVGAMSLLLINGCGGSSEDKERIANAEDNLKKIALEPSIVYPAEGDTINKTIIVRVDVDESVTYEKVSLLINGVEAGVDTEAPYEFEWQPYFWSSESNVSLLARATTTEGSLLRSETRSVALAEGAFNQSIALTSALETSYPYGTSEVSVSWSALSTAIGYEVKVNDNEANAVENATTNVAMEEAGTYNVFIRATDARGNTGSWNSIASLKIRPPNGPVATLIDSEEGSNKVVNVTLDDSADYKAISLVVNGKVVETLTEPPYKFNWAPYFWSSSNAITWSISAEFSNGDLQSSEPSNISAEDVATLLKTITVETVTGETEFKNVNEVNIKWTAIDEAANYQYRINGSQLDAESTAASISTLELDDYTIQVRALDTKGRTGAWSAPLNISVIAPNAPTIASPSNGAAIANIGEVTVTWDAEDGASSYEYSLGSIIQQTQIASFSFSVPNTGTYYYSVRSVDSFGRKGAWSNHHSVDILNPPLARISVETIENDTDFSLSITWSTPEYAQDYTAVVEIAKDPEFNNSLSGTPIEVTAIQEQITQNVPTGRYYIRARFVDNFDHYGNWYSAGTVAPGLFKVEANIASYGWDTTDSPVDFLIDGSDIVVLSSKADSSDGSSDDFHLSKWNTHGDKMWGNSFSTIATGAQSIDKIPNGGYVMAGKGSRWVDALILATDKSGNYLWRDTVDGETDANGNSTRSESIYDIVALAENEFAYAKRATNYVRDANGSSTSSTTSYSIVRYNRSSLEENVTEINQPESGEFSYPSQLLFSEGNLYAAGGYKAEGASYDASDDSYVPQESTSGAYLVELDPENDTIISTRTGGGLGNSTLGNISTSDFGIIVGYNDYYAGGATLFDPLTGYEAVVEPGIRYSRAVVDPRNGDILLIGKDRDSAVYGEPIVAIRYRNGLEIDRKYIRTGFSDLNLRKVEYHAKYGVVILGTDDTAYNSSDKQTVIFNLNNEFEYLDN